jgi:hypothetical protein
VLYLSSWEDWYKRGENLRSTRHSDPIPKYYKETFPRGARTASANDEAFSGRNLALRDKITSRKF